MPGVTRFVPRPAGLEPQFEVAINQELHTKTYESAVVVDYRTMNSITARLQLFCRHILSGVRYLLAIAYRPIGKKMILEHERIHSHVPEYFCSRLLGGCLCSVIRVSDTRHDNVTERRRKGLFVRRYIKNDVVADLRNDQLYRFEVTAPRAKYRASQHETDDQ